MKKQLMIVGVILMLLAVGLSGCIDNTETPKIEFIKEDSWLVVSFVEKSNISWNNINISLSSGKYSDIGFHTSIEISSIKPYNNGASCPDDWDFIAEDNGILFQNINATVTLFWIPTNTSLGEWYFT